MSSTNIMGIPVDNPVLVASGPWSRGIGNMKKLLHCGAGAVITETIVSESYPDTRPRYAYDGSSGGVQNIRIYSGMELENWLSDLSEINREKRYGSNTRLIASIMGTTASELRYIAGKVEKTGVDGIEIGLACPMGEGPQIIAGDSALVYEYVKSVASSVGIPVSVKLSAFAGNLPDVVRAAERAGASGISAIDTLRCILRIDTETGKPALPTYGGYSGVPIKPMGLAAVAGIVQSTSLPVIGMGGIRNHTDLLEYIMVGASACGIGTEILLKGHDVIETIKRGLEDWLTSHDGKSLDDIRGCALKELRPFEEINQEEKTAELAEPCRDSACGRCAASCLQGAIEIRGGTVDIDRDKCDGCGLCLSICPHQKFRLTW